ncbi:[acyl-carrier-protein] S-malonyltransferase [Mesorhizobium sp. M1E.F.Ca.ET.045.02.1.1]|uniref:ACP S-malonyltransferase n=1 Tax=unclassified Mesorhizobium TaxID=325217 RepID=UPI000F750C59|nr:MULTISPECIES: ACP S-malonyltransferase [unclassified Mesorhizobium]RWD88175.1 MAG: [acyl-carrier-protein] S-malonyltransferase [Mesorhizobium sp.]AZO24760.1 [acyl-carrier-protein] S-malonyltransferase [Mesorhizobium sp. M1E.F.Ca.ET.045.02.1.1]RUW35315.1 [acyl-carrier-protein] S-malonyltransferase [Mesorhizobium sp. M1E.F.Ca.ET.041.01.1.1]RUW83658.1 [acyl-carrier-protein] S-malonyltransferase [Mesorhizobium sp. M1E.F.Ca.ET.063.01.1.1]TKB09242.1 MAG: ACP S-malonyltransferase [Mesorhizobium sp
MAVAFTFPGQGSQSVGMGKDLADAFPEARRVFEEVDEALGEGLSKLIWEGPEETLTLTANAQPALMAVSLAALRALESRGFSLKDKVSYVAGHSLGEYSALAAAGFVSIADAARLLRIRGNAMQAAVPAGEGAMAAIIGLEQAGVEAACAEAAKGSVCQIANDNGGGQLVISGAKAAVELAAKLCTEKGAKRALMLQVSAPFHSALMAPAAETMREALAGVAKNAPVVPVVSNVTVTPTDDPDEIARRLVQQVTGRVRWRETVEWFGANGVATLYEVGAGKVLSGLARRINRDIATAAIGTAAEIDAALAALG